MLVLRSVAPFSRLARGGEYILPKTGTSSSHCTLEIGPVPLIALVSTWIGHIYYILLKLKYLIDSHCQFKWASILRAGSIMWKTMLFNSINFINCFWSKKCGSHFCRESTNENTKFSKTKAWTSISSEQTQLLRATLLWI